MSKPRIDIRLEDGEVIDVELRDAAGHLLLANVFIEDDRSNSRETIELVMAGVNPNHQTDHCDHCGRTFSEDDEVIPTCSNTAYLTLCRQCYTDAGNSVR